MATLREYCEKMSDTQLQGLLREECEGRGSLPLEALLDICDILARRDPEKPSVESVLRDLCRVYL